MHLSTLRAPARGLATLLVLAVPALGQTRGFLVTLGADTVAVERFTKTGDKVEGTVVRHLQGAGMLKYIITFDKDGSVGSYEAGNYRLDGSPVPPNPQTGAAQTGLKMTFAGGGATREVMTNGQPAVRHTSVPKGTLPAIGGGSRFYVELMLQAAKRDGKVHIIGFAANQDSATSPDIRVMGSDSAEIVTAGFREGFRFDRNGQLAHGDGSLTTQKFDVRPIRDADVTTIASAWAAASGPAGKPAPPLSTSDTANATVGTAHVTITYSRPAMRGREIWGTLVPFDTTWRLGANFATQLKTDKDLDIGGTTVATGTYTLWLIPSAGQSYLLVNKGTMDPANNGRAMWGTQWDPAQDIAKIPVESHMHLSMSEERFRIFVQGDMMMMHWGTGGYGVRVKAK